MYILCKCYLIHVYLIILLYIVYFKLLGNCEGILSCCNIISLLFVLHREVQQMRSPAFSRDVSWRGRQMLRKLRNKCKEFLYFFSLWRKSVQMIGGTHAVN